MVELDGVVVVIFVEKAPRRRDTTMPQNRAWSNITVLCILISYVFVCTNELDMVYYST
jgi:hypothetical protein